MVRWHRLEANPILVKELRSRMRGVRAFATLTGILILLGAFSYSLYRIVLASTRFSTSPVSPQIGQALFAGLAFLELMMVCAITPSITAGAISGEQEKQTYEMLLATPLHPISILWGKLISALSYIILLILAVVPMVSLVFIFGGVEARDMLKALIVLVVVAVMVGVIGLFMSALFGRTGRATAVTYLVVLLLLFGPLFFASMTGILQQSQPPRWILIFSPISALASALAPSVSINNISSMFWIVGNTYQWIMGSPSISYVSIPRPIYHYSIPIFIGITLVLYMVTTRLVKPARRWRITWAEVLVGTTLLIGIIGLLLLLFIGTSSRYENFRQQLPETPTPAGVEGRSLISQIPQDFRNLEPVDLIHLDGSV
jgi:ABC-type transport system involved in multi-copper enzyme maturation permease subunit